MKSINSDHILLHADVCKNKYIMKILYNICQAELKQIHTALVILLFNFAILFLKNGTLPRINGKPVHMLFTLYIKAADMAFLSTEKY